MPVALLRLLAVLAVMIMPFGMGAMPASAMPAHAGMVSNGAGHCEEGAPAGKDGKAMPDMACAAACMALPAEPAHVATSDPPSGAPVVAGAVRPLTGAGPPPATPPPKIG